MRAIRTALLTCSAALVLVACSNRKVQDDSQASTPFVFQALNLQQQSAQGKLLWRVRSPEARYDLSRRLALAQNLSGEIYTNGALLYRLRSSHGTVLNDGEVLQLEGKVTVERLGADPVTIRASRMRWYPRQQRLELDRSAQASTKELNLTAKRATLLLDRDLLELRGKPRIQRGGLRLALRRLDWSPGSGQLQTQGPVVATAVSQPNAGAPSRLEAAGLQGNTITRLLELQGPVTFRSPAQQAWLQAGPSIFNVAANTLQSRVPFRAGYGAIAAQGGGFAVDLNRNRVTVLQGCQLQQPGTSLTATSCTWNWVRKRARAIGDVTLRRAALQQVTRAQHLQGRLGDGGLLIFSSPGSTVQSTLRLPPPRPRPQRPAAAIGL